MENTEHPALERTVLIAKYGGDATDRKADDEAQDFIRRAVNSYPGMLEALEYAAQFIPTARRRFPKSIKNRDSFQLENVCATIGTAIAKAKGEPAI